MAPALMASMPARDGYISLMLRDFACTQAGSGFQALPFGYFARAPVSR